MQTQARPIQQVNVKRPSRYAIGPEFVAEVGKWTHVAFTFGKGKRRLYIDGRKVDELYGSVGGFLEAAGVTEAELARRWADALDSALSGEAAPQRQERARRGRALVGSRFSPDRMVEDYLGLGESLLTPGYR